jgi:hypothetical protein
MSEITRRDFITTLAGGFLLAPSFIEGLPGYSRLSEIDLTGFKNLSGLSSPKKQIISLNGEVEFLKWQLMNISTNVLNRSAFHNDR